MKRKALKKKFFLKKKREKITTLIKLYHWLKNVATGKTRHPVAVNSQAGDVL